MGCIGHKLADSVWKRISTSLVWNRVCLSINTRNYFFHQHSLRSETGCRKSKILVWVWVSRFGPHTPTKNAENNPGLLQENGSMNFFIDGTIGDGSEIKKWPLMERSRFLKTWTMDKYCRMTDIGVTVTHVVYLAARGWHHGYFPPFVAPYFNSNMEQSNIRCLLDKLTLQSRF